MQRGGPVKRLGVRLGVIAVVLAIVGWLGTAVLTPILQQPRTVEDLTAAWTPAASARLGGSVTVSVPAGQTLVAFLVGTDLLGIAGTTSGSCTAVSRGEPVDLGWPVLINRSLTGALREDQQTVAIAGWRNDGHDATEVTIRCTTGDSTVEGFVAVPSRTAVVVRKPWFQPWTWIGLGVVGVGLIGFGAQRISRPNR